MKVPSPTPAPDRVSGFNFLTLHGLANIMNRSAFSDTVTRLSRMLLEPFSNSHISLQVDG